jgi:hypothetical protein
LCRAAEVSQVALALRRRDDAELEMLWRRRAALALIFGHALYEHLVIGDSPVRGMAAVVVAGELPADRGRSVERADACLAALLERDDTFLDPRGSGSLPLDSQLFGGFA